MPSHKYRKPKNLVTKIYRGKELQKEMKEVFKKLYTLTETKVVTNKNLRYIKISPKCFQTSWINTLTQLIIYSFFLKAQVKQ